MTLPAWEALVERNLSADGWSADGWIRVKKPAAIIYMGLLARYLASKDPELVQPSTDEAQYEDLIYRCGEHNKPLPGLALSLQGLLPTVAPTTELRDLVEFKAQRRDELIRFRQSIDEVQEKLSKCESQEQAKLLITQFQEQLELDLRIMDRLMDERGIRGVVGTLRTIFGAKSPAWLVAGAAGGAIGGVEAALVSSAASFISGAVIELAHYHLEVGDKNRQNQERPVSYLYSAKREGIVQQPIITDGSKTS